MAGKTTILEHSREALVANISALIAGGMSLRSACSEWKVSPASFLRWKAAMETNGCIQDGTPTGRPPGHQLTKEEVCALRHWNLVKGSALLAVEFFAEDETCEPETRAFIEGLLDRAARERKPLRLPPFLARAVNVTDEERALYRGRKAATNFEVIDRRGLMMTLHDGTQLPSVPNSIWESDDMSSNEPFRFTDADGRERLGRQTLFTQDVFSARWLGFHAIGRERDAYRVEDIAEHMLECVDEYGLPMVWRLERGVWDSTWLHGIELSTGGTWGGLGELIRIEHTWNSKGKGGIETSFNLLQNLIAGQSEGIGRVRGEMESGTRHMLRAQRGADDSLARFWTQSQYAEAMAEACARFNARPKQRMAHGQATVIPDELFAAAHKRVLPTDQRWRFCPIKREATVRNGAVELTETKYYRQTFRFRVNGLRDDTYLPHGLRVLVAFHPGHPERGCHVFNGDISTLNRESWSIGEPLVLGEYLPLKPAVDLSREGDFEGRKKANASVRKEFRSIVATGGAGRKVSTARDGLGNALVAATGRGAEAAQQISGGRREAAVRSVMDHESKDCAPSIRRAVRPIVHHEDEISRLEAELGMK